MSNALIPLFIPTESAILSTDDDAVLEWVEYVFAYKKSINDQHFSTIELFKHNIANQPKLLDFTNVDMWRKIVRYIESSRDPEPFPFRGEALRLIYEASEKSEQIIRLVDESLTRCDIANSRHFICMYKENHEILNVFYNEPKPIIGKDISPASCLKLMIIYTQTQQDPYLRDTDGLYLAQHIYTPTFIEKLNKNSDSTTISYQCGALSHIVENLDELVQSLTGDKNKQLEHLVSLLYSWELMAEYGNLDNRNIHTIPAYFKEKFPNEYAQHQTLKSLGITPKPSEFLTGLTSTSPNIDLPELN